MKKKIVISSLFFLFLVKFSTGQDIHFSQFDINPVLLNPAHLGFLDSKGRFGTIYRNQWSSVGTPYRTFAFTGEWSTYKRRYYGDGINLGLILTTDEAGALNYGNTQCNAVVSYFRSLNKFANHFISIGASLGIGQQSFNSANAILPEQDENFETTNAKYADLSLGIAWLYNPNDNLSLKMGVNANHLNSPNISYMGLDEAYLHPNVGIYGRVEIYAGNEFYILPSGIYKFQHTYNEIIYGSNFKWYPPGYSYNLSFNGGLFFRHSDAIILSLGLEFDNFILGTSYDINISDLHVGSNGKGGFEIALLYRLITNKSKHLKVIPCPTFL